MAPIASGFLYSMLEHWKAEGFRGAKTIRLSQPHVSECCCRTPLEDRESFSVRVGFPGGFPLTGHNIGELRDLRLCNSRDSVWAFKVGVSYAATDCEFGRVLGFFTIGKGGRIPTRPGGICSGLQAAPPCAVHSIARECRFSVNTSHNDLEARACERSGPNFLFFRALFFRRFFSNWLVFCDTVMCIHRERVWKDETACPAGSLPGQVGFLFKHARHPFRYVIGGLLHGGAVDRG